METEFLKLLIIIFGVSAVLIYVLSRLKIPTIIGFLIAGLILGPYGLGLIGNMQQIESLATIGIVLLMFAIGLDLSLKIFFSVRPVFFLGGLLLILLTIFFTALVSRYCFSQPLPLAVFIGFMLSTNSTAIAMKMLADRDEVNSPTGQMTVWMQVFGDLWVVPFMMLIPVLSGGNGFDSSELFLTLGKAGLVLSLVFIIARWAVPFILHQIVASRVRELFLLSLIILCLGIAFVTSQIGLSLALGAFLAGLAISESDYAAQAISEIAPLKESFAGIFFISVGMLLDLSFVAGHLPLLIMLAFAVVLGKAVLSILCFSISAPPLPHLVKTSVYIAQIGEFSFVLVAAGRLAGLVPDDIYQVFLAVSVLTMILSPAAINLTGMYSSRLGAIGFLKRFASNEDFPVEPLTDHVIVVGFGLNGRNVARVLRRSGIPYLVLEMNGITVRSAKSKGEPICFGDGAVPEMLKRLNIQSAKALVVAISDPAATRKIVQIARAENRRLYIIARTRYLVEVEDLQRLGADMVIPEEFETSIEIFSHLLSLFNVPDSEIAEYVNEIRKDSYKMLRIPGFPDTRPVMMAPLRDIETAHYYIPKGSGIAGLSIAALNLRNLTGATIVSVERGEKIYSNPQADFVIAEGDLLHFFGKPSETKKALNLLRTYHP